ncbi:MAG: hypothetical protein V1929_12700 [bacterium]
MAEERMCLVSWIGKYGKISEDEKNDYTKRGQMDPRVLFDAKELVRPADIRKGELPEVNERHGDAILWDHIMEAPCLVILSGTEHERKLFCFDQLPTLKKDELERKLQECKGGLKAKLPLRIADIVRQNEVLKRVLLVEKLPMPKAGREEQYVT